MNNKLLEEALALEATMVADRRYIHQHAEIGSDLPLTREYVLSRLTAMGYEPQEICPAGIVAVIGQGGPTLLLRADMDALPMQEESGLPYASLTDNAHTCGHDIHTATLLAAAQLLKNHEDELQGTVKLMFQPAEETISGAAAMIAAGVLEAPAVDAAVAMHVSSGHEKGVVYYRPGDIYASADGFGITIYGKGGHGASPNYCIDPINMAAQLYIALQPLISREKDPAKQAVLTIGAIHGGTANNIIPETVEMLGTLRCYDPEVRRTLKARLTAIAESVTAMYGGRAEVRFFNGTPAMFADEALTAQVVECLKDTLPDEHVQLFPMIFSGSEDFAEISARVPATLLILGCAVSDPEAVYTHHHPKVVFDESAMAYGAAAYAGVALGYTSRQSAK